MAIREKTEIPLEEAMDGDNDDDDDDGGDDDDGDDGIMYVLYDAIHT